MDKLPDEMLELIFWQLAPQDLARCSAVCRSWYDLINQDWIWMKLCDPGLEEPLRTIPSVATPIFEIPDAKTLTPCHWKLAFLREKHLWKNWRPEKILEIKEEDVLKFENETPVDVDFFSDTQIVVWYSNKIVILDASVTPAVIVAKTDIPVTIVNLEFKVVVGNDLLLVQKMNSVEVFKVDVSNKSIILKHSINVSMSDGIFTKYILRKNLYLILDDTKINFKILDLNTGKILKEGSYPEKVNQNERVADCCIYGSPTSDYVCVSYVVHVDYQDPICKTFVYSLKRLAYLPGPVMTFESFRHDVILHDPWIAHLHIPDVISGNGYELTIFHISQKEEVLFHDNISFSSTNFPSVQLCNGWFVFEDEGRDDASPHCLKAYSPSSKTLTTIDGDFRNKHVEVIKNKVIAVFNDNFIINDISETVWKPSSQTVEKCDFSVVSDCETNQSFTKVINQASNKLKEALDGFCWYIKHLW